MKTILKSITALFVGATFILTSCNKYEDGPAFSLRSKTARIANTWQVDKAYEDAEDVTDQYDQYELQMFSNGDARLAALYTFGDFTFEFETDGTWEFENNAEDLALDFDNDDADRTYEILRLKEDELWLKAKGGSTELHLEPK